jgi:hypothetical protein
MDKYIEIIDLTKDDEEIINEEIINIDYIQNRIKQEICHDTIKELDLENFDFKKSRSINEKLIKLKTLLKDVEIDDDKIEYITSNFWKELISAGSKGARRGVKFNDIVKRNIDSLKLDREKFEVGFEKHCDNIDRLTREKPDWYIREKITNKVIIGMNQLDFWDGGHQIQRGNSYILDKKLQFDNKKHKLLCVICKDPCDNIKRNKVLPFFQEGFRNDTLCYIKNISNIINSFFNIE